MAGSRWRTRNSLCRNEIDCRATGCASVAVGCCFRPKDPDLRRPLSLCLSGASDRDARPTPAPGSIPPRKSVSDGDRWYAAMAQSRGHRDSRETKITAHSTAPITFSSRNFCGFSLLAPMMIGPTMRRPYIKRTPITNSTGRLRISLLALLICFWCFFKAF